MLCDILPMIEELGYLNIKRNEDLSIKSRIASQSKCAHTHTHRLVCVHTAKLECYMDKESPKSR